MASFYEVMINMTRYFSVLTILFCLIQFGCNSQKDISGQIMDEQGNPVEGATLILTVWDQKKDRVPTKIIETIRSGRNGEFGIDIGDENPETKLAMGVEKDGFKLVSMQFTPLLIQKNSEVFKNYRVMLEKK